MTDRFVQERHISEVHSKIGKKEFIVMMAVLMAINAIAIDITLPVMEQIKENFHASGLNEHQYIIFSYLLGFGVSQLIFGPISDQFGRRIPLIFGLLFYAFSSLACTFAPNFLALLSLRTLQGVGGAATRVITISIIRDLYHGRKMAEVMSIVMMVFMIVPVIAPVTGQTILLIGAWPIVFNLMAITSLMIACWVIMKLPETIFEKRPFTFSSVKADFKHVLYNRTAFCYTLALSVILGAFFGALNTATQIYNGIYHLGNWFPTAFATVAVFQAASSFFNAKFVEKFGMRKISHTMLLCFIGTSFIWFILSLIDVIPFFVYMGLFVTIMFSFGTLGANFNALAMEPLGEIAGTASSIFGFMQTTIGASLGILIGQIFDGTTIPIASGFLSFGLIGLILVLIAEKGKLFRSKNMPTPIERAERIKK